MYPRNTRHGTTTAISFVVDHHVEWRRQGKLEQSTLYFSSLTYCLEPREIPLSILAELCEWLGA